MGRRPQKPQQMSTTDVLEQAGAVGASPEPAVVEAAKADAQVAAGDAERAIRKRLAHQTSVEMALEALPAVRTAVEAAATDAVLEPAAEAQMPAVEAAATDAVLEPAAEAQMTAVATDREMAAAAQAGAVAAAVAAEEAG
jgi:hypothetical protein